MCFFSEVMLKVTGQGDEHTVREELEFARVDPELEGVEGLQGAECFGQLCDVLLGPLSNGQDDLPTVGAQVFGARGDIHVRKVRLGSRINREQSVQSVCTDAFSHRDYAITNVHNQYFVLCREHGGSKPARSEAENVPEMMLKGANMLTSK